MVGFPFPVGHQCRGTGQLVRRFWLYPVHLKALVGDGFLDASAVYVVRWRLVLANDTDCVPWAMARRQRLAAGIASESLQPIPSFRFEHKQAHDRSSFS